jgi:hypothetical protein
MKQYMEKPGFQRFGERYNSFIYNKLYGGIGYIVLAYFLHI